MILTGMRIFLLIVAFLPEVQSQTSSPHDECIDQAFTRFHQALATKFPQYENFTVALPSSRHLFQVMLAQNFTTDTLKDFCHTYETVRKDYDQCADSNYKRAALSGFGLADFMCLRRLNDFANGIPCLQRADRTATDNCRSSCTQYERASYSYLHPTEQQSDSDLTTFMAGDCQYLKCWADCRAPYLANQCDNKTAALEMESLMASYSSLYGLYAPELLLSPTATPPSAAAHFPNECRPFVNQTYVGGLSPLLNDVLGATTTAATSSSSTSTRNILLATTTTAHGGASRTTVLDTAVCLLVVLCTLLISSQ